MINFCRLPKIEYYYNIYLMNDTHEDFEKWSMISYLMTILELNDERDLGDYTLPSDLATNDDIYDELISLVFSRYRTHANIKIEKWLTDGEPTTQELSNAVKEWAYRFMALLNDTHNYYVKMLSLYKDSEDKLLDDIKATSKNKVKFNDTPQNTNVSGTYEGDNYITHFTATEGETSSELNSKIMRLKEIQDNYRDMMSIWVKDFERLFYQEEVR